jgi:hypothetical protein
MLLRVFLFATIFSLLALKEEAVKFLSSTLHLTSPVTVPLTAWSSRLDLWYEDIEDLFWGFFLHYGCPAFSATSKFLKAHVVCSRSRGN